MKFKISKFAMRIGVTLGIFLSPLYALATSYTGAGFGDTNVNTTFTDSGNTNNGQPVYCNSPYSYTLVYNGTTWDLSSGGSCNSPTNCAYESNSASTTPNGTYHTRGCGETAPAGTISVAGGGGGGGGGGSGGGSLPTSTLLSIVGLPILQLDATYTSSTLTATYTANTTTQAILNAVTDHTQENLFFGFFLFFVVSGGIIYYFLCRLKN